MGFWKRMPGDSCTRRGRAFGLPMVGDVAAGFPSPAEEELRDVISFDEYLITKPGTSFLLRVSGDSMIDEGIHQGDLVVIEKGREPKSGDIVIAEVDGEWTLKFFRKKGKDVFLEAANAKYPPIRARSELRVGGVVSAVDPQIPGLTVFRRQDRQHHKQEKHTQRSQ